MPDPHIPRLPAFRNAPLDPPAAFATYQDAGELPLARLWNGQTVQLVTRHEDVRKVLSDPAFSAVPHARGYPMLSHARRDLLLGEHPTFQRMDPPEHTPFRRMFMCHFSDRQIESLRPRSCQKKLS